MPKTERGQLGINWNAEKRALWDRIAGINGAAPSTLARDVLEEFMACFATRDQMLAVGLIRPFEQRPGYYLRKAMQNVPYPTLTGIANSGTERLTNEPARRKRA